MVGQAEPVIAPVHEHAREFPSVHPVEDETEAQDGQGLAAAPSGSFQHQCHQQGGHHHVHITGPSGPFHDPQIIMPDIEGNHKGNGGQEPVKPAGFGPAGFFPHGIHQKTHGTHHGHMERPVHQGDRRPENGRVQMVQRNQDGKNIKEAFDFSGEFPGGAFLIHLFNDGIGLGGHFFRHIPGDDPVLIDGSLGEGVCTRFCRAFLQIVHRNTPSSL